MAETRDRLAAVLPLLDHERDFLDALLGPGELRPELVSDDPAMQDRLRTHPGLLWKAQNVRAYRAGPDAVLVPVHAFESTGVNAIPLALAEELGRRLKLAVAKSIVQINLVGHTGASGFARLARQAVFDGEVEAGRNHLLVDDFVGQGGTLANLRGHVLRLAATWSAPRCSPASYIRLSSRCRHRPWTSCGGSMDRSSNAGGETGSVTASTASLNQRLGTSSAPRMLNASEIALLRSSLREIAEWIERRREEQEPVSAIR